jgi:hypothetical protein
MGVFSYVKLGKKIFGKKSPTIKSVKPTFPKTKMSQALRDVKMTALKTKGSIKKGSQDMDRDIQKVKSKLGQTMQKLKGEPVTKSGFSKGKDLREKKMGGGMMGRRFGMKKGSKLQDVMKAAARDMQKTGRGKQFRKNTFVDPKTGRIVPDTKRNVKRYEARVKKMGGGMMGRRMGYSEGKLAETPREKKLAAQYGDKKRITRGDIITIAKKKSGEEPMRDRMKQPLKRKKK